MARARLVYTAGDEHNPGDPFGKHELSIEPDGGARLTHVLGGMARTWTARVPPAVLDRVWLALGQGGFPDVPQHKVPAGSTMRMLEAYAGGDRKAAFVEWHAARKMAGYADAFHILDSIARAISGAALVPNPEAGVVTDVAGPR